MQSLVMTLVFSIVMLMFMIYPSMLIVEWIDKYTPLNERTRNWLSILFTVLLSLSIGIFLENV